MPAPVSAGLLLHRRGGDGPQFLLAHPGGPFWRNKDAGAWTIPKGMVEPGEAPLAAAMRELREETGFVVEGPFDPLSPVRQKAGKRVLAWLVEADPDLAAFASMEFETEWPPRSGQRARFPEVDRVAWFSAEAACEAILAGQRPLIEEALARM